MIRKLFLIAAAFALIVNSFSDFELYNHNKIVIQSGESLNRVYEVTKRIDSTRVTLFESMQTNAVSPDFYKNIQMLREVLLHPELLVRLKRIEMLGESDLLAKQNNVAQIELSQMAEAQGDFLKKEITKDQELSSEAMRKVFLCNFIDILLILLFVGFFLFERRSSMMMQNALANTLLATQASRERLKKAIAKKDARLKSAVHDLKNPLGSIRGFAELLHDDSDNPKSVTQMSSMIQRISNNTLNLVNYLLVEDEGGPYSEYFNLTDCLRETCHFLAPVASEKSQSILMSRNLPEVKYTGVKDEVQNIFFNIIGNALKFSPHGSTVSVGCSKNESDFEITIDDQGPGFSDEDLEKLFQRGAKLSAKPTGSEVSTGIGLVTVKEAMEKSGGTIRVGNNSQRGGRVILRFPISSKTLPSHAHPSLEIS